MDEMRECRTCGETKPISDYYSDRTVRCRRCHCQHMKDWQAGRLTRQRRYGRRNTVRMSDAQRLERRRLQNRQSKQRRRADPAYRAARRAQERLRYAAMSDAAKAAMRARIAAWRARNPDRTAEYERRNRLRRKLHRPTSGTLEPTNRSETSGTLETET